MQRIPMTLEGAQQLRQELKRRKFTDRPLIIEEIAEARAHGDLKENAEYHAAREKQGFNEGRIAEIESVLNSLQEIDVSKLNAGNEIVFGAKVSLLNLQTQQEVDYQLVGPYETDVEVGKISVTSPIGKALLGKSVKDFVLVQAPNGDKEFEVIKVSY